MARPVRDRITYAHPNFAGEPHPRGKAYARLLSVGHAVRPEAGLFDETVLKAVKKGKVTRPDITRILAAADEELARTGQTREVFHPELETFYEEWGWAFSSGATEALREELAVTTLPYIPSLTLDSAPGAQNTRHSNALFMEAAVDGKITAQEIESLEKTNRDLYDQDTVENNMQRLYARHELDFEVEGLIALRARIDDHSLIDLLDLAKEIARIFESPVGELEAQEIIKATQSHCPHSSSRLNLNRYFEDALSRRGNKNWPAHPSLTPEGRQVLDDFFCGQAKVDRTLKEFAQKSDVTVEEVEGLMELIQWATDGADDELWAQAHAMADIMGVPYFEDPRLSDEAIAVLDRGFYWEGTAAARQRMQGADVLGMLDIASELTLRSQDHWHGDSEEGDVVHVRYSDHSRKLSIKGLAEIGAVTVRVSPFSVEVDGKRLGLDDAGALLQQPQIVTVVHALMARAVTTGWRDPEAR